MGGDLCETSFRPIGKHSLLGHSRSIGTSQLTHNTALVTLYHTRND